jgi:hypothetical protein
MGKKSKKTKKPQKPGPKADTLIIAGNYKEAIKASLEKEKPPEGWPK